MLGNVRNTRILHCLIVLMVKVPVHVDTFYVQMYFMVEMPIHAQVLRI